MNAKPLQPADLAMTQDIVSIMMISDLPDVSQLHTLGIELAEKNVSIEDVGLDSAREVYRFWAGYSGTEGDHARYCNLSLEGGPLCDHSPRANSGYNVLCVTN